MLLSDTLDVVLVAIVFVGRPALLAAGTGCELSSCYSTHDATAPLKFTLLNFSLHERCIKASATAEGCAVAYRMVRVALSPFHSQDTYGIIPLTKIWRFYLVL